MGIKSTYNISRRTAIDVINSKVYECTNDQLASMLLDFEESYFRNYSVTENLPDAPSEEWECFDSSIRTVSDFNNTF